MHGLIIWTFNLEKSTNYCKPLVMSIDYALSRTSGTIGMSILPGLNCMTMQAFLDLSRVEGCNKLDYAVLFVIAVAEDN
jgi:hypothetical protein